MVVLISKHSKICDLNRTKTFLWVYCLSNATVCTHASLKSKTSKLLTLIRCLWPVWAVGSMKQERTLTRQKPFSPRNEIPALLRCTPESLAVRKVTQMIQKPSSFWCCSIACHFCSDLHSAFVCLCLAGDKKMMVPSSTAGGQQLYSQSSPFQQGHSGKGFG